jgi:hypothetical protein
MSTSSRTRSFIRKAWLPLLGVGLWIAGCASSTGSLVVFVSGDSRGYLEPCGCRRDQAGGLPGRARLVSGVAESDRLVLDVGNLGSGTRDYDLLKLKYMLQGMEAIGYDAVNLGKSEATLDLDTLRKVLDSSKLPFVSANVVAKSGRQPITEPFRVIDRGGSRIGVIGVTECEGRDMGPGVEVRPPLEALAEVIPQVRPKCDYLVVLAFVDADTIAEIANKFHEVDAVFGGDVPQTSSGVQKVNRASVFNVTDRGKVVGKLNLTRNGKTFTISNAQGVKILADKLAPPQAIASLLASYKDELRERRYELASAEGMETIQTKDSTSNEYVGSSTCNSCHTDAHKTWTGSGHSHAFATLEKVKSDFDPDCLRCHTVGYGLSSGFIDKAKTPKLAGVQCENCHGRGKEHAATQKKTALKPVTASTCIKCHDQENSENFRYEAFWPKIAH